MARGRIRYKLLGGHERSTRAGFRVVDVTPRSMLGGLVPSCDPKVIVLRSVLFLMAFAGLALVATPALASTDACLTWEGVWVAPWTDAQDPACGEACEAGAELASDRVCSTTEGTCSVNADAIAFELRMPAPQRDERPGPRCLAPGPECSPGGGGGSSFALAGGLALGAQAVDVPSRAGGTLPGAPGPQTHHQAFEIDPTTRPRPPRA